MLIREATIADAVQIASVHVKSWQTTYRGIIADDYLDSLSVDQRIRNWKWTFNNMNVHDRIFVAVADNGRIVGFANGGGCREPERGYDSELYAIYLLEPYQRAGIGKQLFRHVRDALRNTDRSSMMLWVLADNPSLTFYLAQGGQIIDQQEIRIGNEDLPELLIGWNPI
ncbi:GNAT family N-acetyltransferase [Paenibacillus sp. OV219]|uniref:GNAT family N-acetyltransferase n=1 Tax=Paenibacillus sp. OV219 TaxID=1884377 RepID=UPI0008B3888A|nr:GNAT family N-acetyltransferase [Paenibacillus sp. OV219]SEO97936.1 L-amino acid N-acyltransferase YncA [Paenibacillus sp. OV219]